MKHAEVRAEGRNAHRRVMGGYRWSEEWADMQVRNCDIKHLLVDACHRSTKNSDIADLLVQALELHVDNMLVHAELSTYRKGTS